MLAEALLLGQTVHRFQGEVKIPVDLPYVVALPEGYADSKRRWPVVLFLHGSGERGSDIQKVYAHGPLKEIAQGRKIPAIVVVPQLPDTERGWNPYALGGLLDRVAKDYRTDSKRVSVTGLSMGGFGTFALAAAYPKRFMSLAPICGGGVPSQAAAYAQVPMWVVHGDQDKAVNVVESMKMVAALEKAGGTPRFDVIKGGEHDVWTQTYSQDAFWTWLLNPS